MRGEVTSPAQQAALCYELWRLVPDNEEARTAASALYRSQYAETGLYLYRRRYQELTGETLPDPPPLPDVSMLIPADPVDLDGLMDRLEPILARMDASFS
jgi:hypothetical protein